MTDPNPVGNVHCLTTSWNINGIEALSAENPNNQPRNNMIRRQIRQMAKKHQIILLQETHLPKDHTNRTQFHRDTTGIKNILPNWRIFPNGIAAGKHGTLTGIDPKNFPNCTISNINLIPGRVQITYATHNLANKGQAFINVYLPVGQWPSKRQILDKIMTRFDPNYIWTMGGDWNFTHDSTTNQRFMKKYAELLHRFSLYEPTQPYDTWFRITKNTKYTTSSNLDRLLTQASEMKLTRWDVFSYLTPTVFRKRANDQTRQTNPSDHLPITLLVKKKTHP